MARDRDDDDDSDIDDMIRRRRKKRAAQSRFRLVLLAAVAVLIALCGGGIFVASWLKRGVGQGDGVAGGGGGLFSSPAKTLDSDTYFAFNQEYADNPVVAAKKYNGTRWRFEARVSSIRSESKVGLQYRHMPGLGSCTATASRSEIERLKVDRFYVFEAELASYKPRIAKSYVQEADLQFSKLEIISEAPKWPELSD